MANGSSAGSSTGSNTEQGGLQPCPASPNCVSSQADPADAKHYLPPVAVSGEPLVISSVAAALSELPRTTIVEQTDTYLHAEVRSRVFGFVDDVEFVYDLSAKVLHFRSASRLGYSDMGVNRKRMESLSARLRDAL
ncbi:hypothetical protein BH24DEI2_BH24DEI2_04130 [soil metagenome]